MSNENNLTVEKAPVGQNDEKVREFREKLARVPKDKLERVPKEVLREQETLEEKAAVQSYSESEDQRWDAFFDVWYAQTDIEILEMLRDRLAESFRGEWDLGFVDIERDPSIKAAGAFLHFEISQLLDRLSKFNENLKTIEAQEDKI